jgi:ribosomal protein S27AE
MRKSALGLHPSSEGNVAVSKHSESYCPNCKSNKMIQIYPRDWACQKCGYEESFDFDKRKMIITRPKKGTKWLRI